MAKLSSFTRDSAKISDGDRVEVGFGEDKFHITTRGFTPAYRDRLFDLKREAARRLNRDLKPGAIGYLPDTLPPSEDDKCQGQAVAEECVLGVEGLDGDDGQPLGVETFRSLLSSGVHPALISLAIAAAGRVGSQREAEARADLGN